MTQPSAELQQRIRAFVSEREWQRYHSPKELAVGLALEAAELLELFQWLTTEESREISGERAQLIRSEIGDVMIYLAELADSFGLDPLECADAKLEDNARKYPIDLAKGNARKYSELRGSLGIER